MSHTVTPDHDAHGKGRWWIIACTTALLLIGTFFLFFRLGHYALWDDETVTALVAKNVWETGDTGILVGHNIVAYRNGLLSVNMRDRATPPFSTYLAAPMAGLFEGRTFAMRFPFALFGWATLALILWWLREARTKPSLHLAFCVALLANVSFFLYSRQCRYYAPSIFFTVLIAYFYMRWKGEWKTALAIALASILLFATNYMNYAILYVCITVDYIIWKRKKFRLEPTSLAALIIPQMLICGAIASIWNPFQTGFGAYVGKNTMADRLTLLWWNFRDLNRAEFFVGILVLVAPLLGFIKGKPWLLRGTTALVVYIVSVTAVSPQLVAQTNVADVRYLAPIIPLGCFLGAGVIHASLEPRILATFLAALLAFGTNLLHTTPLSTGSIQSTVVKFIVELLHPPSDPYTAGARWINEHVSESESILVVPENMAYPLMYHAPGPVYAWQLTYPPQEQFKGLPDIHFRGKILPDYVFVFGPSVSNVVKMLRDWSAKGANYEFITPIDHFWSDMHRPELFWHTFTPINDYNRKNEAIYVFRRTTSFNDD